MKMLLNEESPYSFLPYSLLSMSVLQSPKNTASSGRNYMSKNIPDYIDLLFVTVKTGETEQTRTQHSSSRLATYDSRSNKS